MRYAGLILDAVLALGLMLPAAARARDRGPDG
jgi:hypothetical protein